MEVSELLAFTVKNKASDLHLSAGEPPMIRINGDMTRIKMQKLIDAKFKPWSMTS